jgi:hypothetical protein
MWGNGVWIPPVLRVGWLTRPTARRVVALRPITFNPKAVLPMTTPSVPFASFVMLISGAIAAQGAQAAGADARVHASHDSFLLA